MRTIHFILVLFLLTTVQPMEVKADENAEHDVYRKNLLKEVLNENMIGQLYHQGNVLPRDDTRAAHYYHISSVRGKPEAQFHLGQLFWNGSGVPHSPINAYARWILARDNIFDSSLYPYPLIKAALDNADKSMTRSDKSAANRKAKQLIKEHESMGIVEGKRMGSILKMAP